MSSFQAAPPAVLRSPAAMQEAPGSPRGLFRIWSALLHLPTLLRLWEFLQVENMNPITKAWMQAIKCMKCMRPLRSGVASSLGRPPTLQQHGRWAANCALSIMLPAHAQAWPCMGADWS